MKKIINMFLLVTIILTTALAITGCTTDEKTLYNALSKSQEIKSMEAKSDIALRFTASGVPESDKESVQQAIAMLNNLKIKIDQKIVRSEDNLSAQGQIDGTVDMGGMAVGGTIWVDTNLKGDKPIIKETFKLPQILMMSMPQEFAGKEYLYLDLEEMMKEDPEYNANMSGILKASSQYQSILSTKAVEFLNKYSAQYDPKMTVVTRNGDKLIGGENLPLYQVSLDDKEFKALVKYTANNLLNNPEAMNFLNEMLMTFAEKGSTGETDTAIQAIKEQMPEFIKNMNNVLDTFDNVKILGDKGMTIDYAVNKDGFIVYESGSIDFVVDVAALNAASEKLGGESSGDQETGVYNIGLDFTTELSNINKDIQITFPVLTSSNSVNFVDMMKNSDLQENDPTPDEISVYVNGKKLELDAKPIMLNGRVLVPVKGVFESLGTQVKWDSKTKTVTGIKGSKKIVMKLNSKNATVNGIKKTLDVPAFTVSGRTYIPLRFLSESVGADIKWDAAAKTIRLTSK